jgi:hypothetical protein
LTGHIVFTTLHTNDAPSAVTRLRDMGVAPFLITATVEGVLAQRLVRKVCTSCRTEFRPSEEIVMGIAGLSMSRQIFGNYDAGLYIAAGVLTSCAVLVSFLPQYRFKAGSEPQMLGAEQPQSA